MVKYEVNRGNMMKHPETWHILPGESNWETGDPYAIYLEHENQGYCIMFMTPILHDLHTPTYEDAEEGVNDFMDVIIGDVHHEDVMVFALNYYLVHELIHWASER